MLTQDVKPLPVIWRGSAKIFAALGDEHRQRILLMCRKKPDLRLRDVFGALPLSRTAIVHHIAVLRGAGLVTAGKRGGEVHLTLNQQMLERLAKVTTLLRSN